MTISRTLSLRRRLIPFGLNFITGTQLYPSCAMIAIHIWRSHNLKVPNFVDPLNHEIQGYVGRDVNLPPGRKSSRPPNVPGTADFTDATSNTGA